MARRSAPWTTLTPRVAHYKFSQQQLKTNAENSSVVILPATPGLRLTAGERAYTVGIIVRRVAAAPTGGHVASFPRPDRRRSLPACARGWLLIGRPAAVHRPRRQPGL